MAKSNAIYDTCLKTFQHVHPQWLSRCPTYTPPPFRQFILPIKLHKLGKVIKMGLFKKKEAIKNNVWVIFKNGLRSKNMLYLHKHVCKQESVPLTVEHHISANWLQLFSKGVCEQDGIDLIGKIFVELPFQHVYLKKVMPYVWDMLMRKVRQRRNVPETIIELQAALEEEWENIPQESIRTPKQIKKCWENLKTKRKHGGPFPGLTPEDPDVDKILNNVNIEIPEAVDNDTIDLASGNNEKNYEIGEDGNLIPIENFEASFLTSKKRRRRNKTAKKENGGRGKEENGKVCASPNHGLRIAWMENGRGHIYKAMAAKAYYEKLTMEVEELRRAHDFEQEQRRRLQQFEEEKNMLELEIKKKKICK
ncbi:hypothetical protein C0J52_02770 [Blattella germanica]|nr:hypothetical protein C0J52_02770 [Blattella germanica]